MTHHVPVVIEQDEDGVFIVSAPTIPVLRHGVELTGHRWTRFKHG